jgi:hypothetical protein
MSTVLASIQKNLIDDSAAGLDSTYSSSKIEALLEEGGVEFPAGTDGYLAAHSGTPGVYGTPVNPASFAPVGSVLQAVWNKIYESGLKKYFYYFEKRG